MEEYACGDFKSTLNPVLENEEYPMPGADELFIKIQSGMKYSKVDLSRAYLQVELNEESQKFCVINTCKGRRQYTRMPYGIKPASGIFQKLIENQLNDIPMIFWFQEVMIQNICKISKKFSKYWKIWGSQ